MKKIFDIAVVTILMFAGFSVNAAESAAGNETARFEEANGLYLEGDFAGAAELYRSIEEAGYYSANLFYNMGNAYFKQSLYSKAILYYERALVANPSDEDVLANLEMAKSFTVDKIEEVPEFIMRTWFRNFTYSISSDAWAWTGLGAVVLTVIFLLLYFFGSRYGLRKASFFVAVAFFAVGIFSVTLAFVQKNDYEQNRNAIVMAAVSAVKGAPDDSGTSLLILHEGAKVAVLEDLTSWMRVELPDGRQGWIKGNDIEII